MSDDKSEPVTKPKFLKSRKGKLVLGIALLIASFWTAYALDYVVNPTPPTEDFHVMLTEHCWTNYQKKTIDDSIVYMGLECYNTITEIDEVSIALKKMKSIGEENGVEIKFAPGQAHTLYQKFVKYGSEPGDNT